MNWIKQLFAHRYKRRATAPAKSRISVRTSMFERKRQALFKMLQAFSYEKRDIVLASGQQSDTYIDCKQTALTGRGHYLIASLFFDLLKQVEQYADRPYVAVGGMALGAAPLASALATHCYAAGRELNAIYVRKESKGHGTNSALEGLGAIPKGAKVLVVEDVIATGGSTLRAVAEFRAAGYIVDTVFALVDRKAGGREALGAEGLQLHSLFDLQDFERGNL